MNKNFQQRTKTKNKMQVF